MLNFNIIIFIFFFFFCFTVLAFHFGNLFKNLSHSQDSFHKDINAGICTKMFHMGLYTLAGSESQSGCSSPGKCVRTYVMEILRTTMQH